jgi:hypothetical protein
VGSHTVFLNPSGGYPANAVELVFPLKWMHNFLKNPEIGSQNNLKIILDFLTCHDGVFSDSDWPKYNIENASKANAKEANPKELMGWIQALTDKLVSETNLSEYRVNELLKELVPFSVLTGWDMDIGDQDWGFLIYLLVNYPDLDEIRVQVGDTSLISVLASGAVDREGSLRTTSLKGWFDFETFHRHPEGKIVDIKDVNEKDLDPRYRKNMDVIEFLTATSVYPPALYTWGERGSHYASINKKVIK